MYSTDHIVSRIDGEDCKLLWSSKEEIRYLSCNESGKKNLSPLNFLIDGD